MTAGRGILHSEMPHNGLNAHGLQLWVNLSSKEKMCPPKYQELPASKVPHVTKDGVEAIVIAGTAFGTTSPISTRTPVYYLHFRMSPNSVLQQEIPLGWNSFVYTLTGTARYGSDDSQSEIGPHNTVTLTNQNGQNGIFVKAGNQNVEFVLLSGKPIGEPVVQHGPFVMNTQQEIEQTFKDYHAGANGFERAPGWLSKNAHRKMKMKGIA